MTTHHHRGDTVSPAARTACCICPPECEVDDTGQTCEDTGCAACLYGCPAPDNQCCNATATEEGSDADTTGK